MQGQAAIGWGTLNRRQQADGCHREREHQPVGRAGGPHPLRRALAGRIVGVASVSMDYGRQLHVDLHGRRRRLLLF